MESLISPNPGKTMQKEQRFGNPGGGGNRLLGGVCMPQTPGSFLPEMSPRVFSFNNPLGACPPCQGLGVERSFSPDLVIDRTATVGEGCIRPFRRSMMSGLGP
ncbi:MAG: hypothetical protein Ct9H90mP1_0750 [Methanobacteriota archaeon]|nr:MAG: hypothetical protein Ct9H90mP1_0750 [Euryarchaeota archaeon]